MYVCNCNGVRSREVDHAIARGARTAKQVLAHQGCQPECCRCLKEITARIRENRDSGVCFAHVAAE
jgi:bacterioferritin-associated ferredoxin